MSDDPDDFQAKLERLRELGDLQGEMARKARRYRERPELGLRFERASMAAVSARMFMQSALMAEREALARDVI